MMLLLFLAAAAQQNPDNGEQAVIYELNRARNNPQRYATENGLGTLLNGVAAAPPLALNTRLVQSAGFHAEEMAANNYFGHQSAVTGTWPNEMARNAGYVLPAAWPDDNNYIESLAAGTPYDTFLIALRELIVDAGINPPGHREHLLATGPNASFWLAHREIGAGHAFNAAATYDDYYAIHTAYVATSNLFLTGVVYNDANGNGRYDINEGIGGVTVSRGAASTTTNSAGGWSLAVTAGSYTVTASGGTFSGTSTAGVTVSGSNIEVDFESGTAAGEVNFANQSGAPAADTDGDGLPDSWETTHFGNLTQTATGNPDGDSANNLAEFNAGTDPMDPASFPSDSDSDGLPDSWEMTHFGNLTQTATGNPDGDGADNLAEFNAGTDPMDPNSVPAPKKKSSGGGCGLTGLGILLPLLFSRLRRR
jgi:uncharacterized protein YkwD